jgi:hypothetical protein
VQRQPFRAMIRNGIDVWPVLLQSDNAREIRLQTTGYGPQELAATSHKTSSQQPVLCSLSNSLSLGVIALMQYQNEGELGRS